MAYSVGQKSSKKRKLLVRIPTLPRVFSQLFQISLYTLPYNEKNLNLSVHFFRNVALCFDQNFSRRSSKSKNFFGPCISELDIKQNDI